MPRPSHLTSVTDTGSRTVTSMLRPAPRDLKWLVEHLASDRTVADALILDPRFASQARWDEFNARNSVAHVPLILDTLGTEGFLPGTTDRVSNQISWSPLLTAGDYGAWARAITEAAATDVADGYDAIITPGIVVAGQTVSQLQHVVEESITELRSALDQRGLATTRLLVPVVATAESLAQNMNAVANQLRRLPVDGVVLRVHLAGIKASKNTVRGYLETTRRLSSLVRLPLIADTTGSFGLGMTAFGGVSAFSSGLTFKETTDVRSLLRKPTNSSPGFQAAPRIYIEQADMYITRKDAEVFFDTRPFKSQFGCQHSCCTQGSQSGYTMTLRDVRGHAVAARQRQVGQLNGVPPNAHASTWIDQWLRPTSDKAHLIATKTGKHEQNRKRMANWREAFSEQLARDIKDGRSTPARDFVLGGTPQPARRHA